MHIRVDNTTWLILFWYHAGFIGILHVNVSTNWNSSEMPRTPISKGKFKIFLKSPKDFNSRKLSLNGENMRASPLRSGMRQECPLSTPIQHSLGNPS